ncbi:MAG: hypothetical protein H6509_05880 [Bryobacterales bacterium]|nr:hypothetical protein [Acidobacteriota bacterium]MCB9384123.1 hypothetical protein [Bryobacterales bacterium]
MKKTFKARIAVSLLALAAMAFPAAAQVAVVNAAGFQANAPVAPGSIASAFGTFTGATTAPAASTPLPTTLGGAQLSVDGAAAPLFFVSAGQINFQTPSSLTPGRHTVTVSVSGSQVATGFLDVSEAFPGLFILDPADVNAPAAALNQDYSVNGPSNPAAKGSVVQLYATGQGPVEAPVADGELAPSDSLSPATLATAVYFAGIEGQVQFSGLAPGFVGVWQINAFVPANSVSGKVPVFVKLDNGLTSNHVSIWVQ